MTVVSPLLLVDPVRLMMALTHLALLAILGIALESALTYGWPTRFQSRYDDMAWYRLYLLAAATFVLAYLGTLWLLYAPYGQLSGLWTLLGLGEVLCASWTLRQTVRLLRGMLASSERATS